MVKRILLTLTVLTLVVLTGHAQLATGGSYTITQSIIASGGGSSSGVGPNIFSITGTGGQSLAGGPMSNAPYNFFSGFWTSLTGPSIVATVPLSRQQGSAAINSQIAMVSDPNQAANTLGVTATPQTGSGVTITGISIDGAGNVTANVVANCTAVNSTFTLTVTDNAAITATAMLTITVSGNTAPTLTYSSPQ